MPLVRMCIESETVGETPGEKSLPFDYTVIESVSLLEDGLFIMVGGTLSTAPHRSLLFHFRFFLCYLLPHPLNQLRQLHLNLPRVSAYTLCFTRLPFA